MCSQEFCENLAESQLTLLLLFFLHHSSIKYLFDPTGNDESTCVAKDCLKKKNNNPVNNTNVLLDRRWFCIDQKKKNPVWFNVQSGSLIGVACCQTRVKPSTVCSATPTETLRRERERPIYLRPCLNATLILSFCFIGRCRLIEGLPAFCSAQAPQTSAVANKTRSDAYRRLLLQKLYPRTNFCVCVRPIIGSTTWS